MKYVKAYATVGGIGFLPLAPGTWGALAGILCLLPFSGAKAEEAFVFLFPLSAILTVFGAKAARRLAGEWGEDPKMFVMDEFVGVWVSLLGHSLTTWNLLWAFLLFRLFDIWKPMGIRKLENVPQGWGVMTDDIGAGIYANLALCLGNYLNAAYL